jgi:hypothetical protein
MAHLDDLMHPILYIASQGGCDCIREVGDSKRFCGILERDRNDSPVRRIRLLTLTESALYSPVDDPDFVGFGFALIIVSYPIDCLSPSELWRL